MQTLYAIGSINDAMRGKRLLEKYGIRAYIQKLSSDAENGCVYGLAVTSSVPQAASVLKQGGVAVREVREREGS